MEHEPLPLLAVHGFDLLLVVGRAERRGDQRLGFAALEHRRTVRPRQHADFDVDRADLVELAAVETLAALERLVAHDLFLQLLEDRLRVAAALDLGVGNARDQVGEHLVDGRVVGQLVLDAHRVGERPVGLLLDLAVELLADLLDLDLGLLLAGLRGERVDAGDDFLDRRVRLLERLDDVFLGDFLGARFDHHDRVLAAGDDQIEPAVLALREGRVDDELAVDQADADAGDRAGERDPRERQRRRGAGDREHVGVVLGVGRQHQRDDLGLVAPAVREERADRPVDQAAGEHFLLGRLAFALEESAGDAARRVGVFLVVDRQREEVDAFARVGRRAGGDEHHRVARADDDGAVGLLGQPAGLDGDGPAADGNFACVHMCLCSLLAAPASGVCASRVRS